MLAARGEVAVARDGGDGGDGGAPGGLLATGAVRGLTATPAGAAGAAASWIAFSVDARAVLVAEVREGAETRVRRAANLKGLRALQFAGTGLACCLLAGYENGLIRVLPAAEDSVVTQREFVLHGAPVQDIAYLANPPRQDPGNHEDNARAGTVWILYEDRTVVCLDVDDAISCASWTEPASMRVFKLKNQRDVHGFAPFRWNPSYYAPEALLWDENEVAACAAHAILAVGVRPAWAVHVTDQADPDATRPAANVGSALVKSVVSSLGSHVFSLARSWGYGGGGGSSSSANNAGSGLEDQAAGSHADSRSEASEEDGGNDVAGIQEESAGEMASAQSLSKSAADAKSSRGTVILPSRHAIFDSVNRVVSGHLNGLDPSQRYAVTVDALGRVVLLDTCGLRLLRIWKGYRDAQTAWLTRPELWGRDQQESSEGTSEGDDAANPGQDLDEIGEDRSGQYLVILAPWRETVQIWRIPGCVLVASMRLPACAVGAVHLVTRVDWASGAARCFLVRDGAENRLDVHEVLTSRGNLERLMTHLSKGKNQQAGFMAHQFRQALASGRFRQAEAVFAETSQADVVWRLLLAMDTDMTGSLLPPAKFHLRMIAHAQKVLGEMKQDAACERLIRLLEVRARLVRMRASLDVSEAAASEAAADSLLEIDIDSSLVPCSAEGLAALPAPHQAGPFGGDDNIEPLSEHSLLRLFGALVLRDLDDLSWTDPANQQIDERAALKALPEPFEATSADEDAASDQRQEKGDQGPTDDQTDAQDDETRDIDNAKASRQTHGGVHMSESVRRGLAAMLFEPVLVDVFSLSKVTSAMAHFGASPAVYLDMLLAWWFGIPLARLLDAASNAPSAIIRLLAQLVQENDDEARSLCRAAKASQRVCHGLVLVRLAARGAGGTKKERLQDVAREMEDTLVICCSAARSDLRSVDLDGASGLFCAVLARAMVEGRDVTAIEDRFPAHCKAGKDLVQGRRALELCEQAGKADLSAILEALRAVDDDAMRRGLVCRVRELAIIPKLKDEAHLSESSCNEAIALIRLLDVKSDSAAETPSVAPDQPGVQGFPGLEESFRQDMHRAQDHLVASRVRIEVVALLALKGLVRVARGSEGASSLMGLLMQLFCRGEEPLRWSLADPLGAQLIASDAAEGAGKDEKNEDGEEETEDVAASRRTRLVQRVLQASVDAPAFAFDLAQALEVPEDKVHIELAHCLYARGDDEAGKASAARVHDKEALALVLLTVARQRMASVLQVLQDLPQYRHLLAVISADTSKWIRAGGVGGSVVNGGTGGVSGTGSDASAVGRQGVALSSTLVLLHEILGHLPPTSPVRRRASQMATAADALFRRVQDAIR